jgi:hypothetical protein
MRVRYREFRHINPSKEVGGRKYDSKHEGNHANVLYLAKKNGEIVDFEPQAKFYLVVEDKYGKKHQIATMKVDFLVTNNDGSQEVHETKVGSAFQSDSFMFKVKLFEALYPDIEYIVIK